MNIVIRAVLAVSMAMVNLAAHAQEYPLRPVRILVPYGPGTGIDLATRILAEKLTHALGKPFVIENKPGAAGTIAGAAVASAAPDGYTLLADASGFTTVPALRKNLPYDPRRDLVGVATFGTSPLVLVTTASTGYKSLKDLIAAGKANPGSLTFASAGVGTATHLAAEKFRVAAGFQALHVPFKSTTDALSEVAAGRINYVVTTLPSAIGLVKSGRLLALSSGVRRVPELPDVPTMAEAGLQNAGADVWFGLFSPAKVPTDVIARLNTEIAKIMAEDDVKQKLSQIGAAPFVNSVPKFEALLQREFTEYEALVNKIGVKIE